MGEKATPEKIMELAKKLRESGRIREETFNSIREAMELQLTGTKQQNQKEEIQ